MALSVSRTCVSLSVKLAFIREVTRRGVGREVDIDSVLKVAAVYGDSTFVGNTTAAAAAACTFNGAVAAATKRLAASYRSPDVVTLAATGAVPPEQSTPFTVNVGIKRFKTTRYSVLHAVWVAHHPHALLLDDFWLRLDEVQDGLMDVETLCLVAGRALSPKIMQAATSAVCEALGALGVGVHDGGGAAVAAESTATCA